MSKAVNPNVNPELPPSEASNDSAGSPRELESPETVATSPMDDGGWRTVDFPGTISIAKLEQAKLVQTGQPNLPDLVQPNLAHGGSEPAAQGAQPSVQPPRPVKSSDLPDLVRHLRQENTALRVQVSQLEADLAQVQVELQLEVTRFFCKESEAIALDGQAPVPQGQDVRDQALTAAQSQIKQLAQELESSQQTIQHQQLLVETLTEQLEGGQERIAQLERDCALTQQRYNEQVQLVLQAETVCRDLRMRLNRQQQQTLQFKIALERSLEIKTVGISDNPPEPKSAVHPAPDTTTQAPDFIPKAQPVKPWSETPEPPTTRFYSVARPHESGLPNLLSDLVPSEQAPDGQSSAPEAIAAGSVDISQLFPETSVPQPVQPVALPASQSAAIFDLSPFLEAGDVDSVTLPAVKTSKDSESMPQSGADDAVAPIIHKKLPTKKPASHQEDNLWADLARLIEPEIVTESGAAESQMPMGQMQMNQMPLLASGQPGANGAVSDPVKTDSAGSQNDSGDQRRSELELAQADREHENRLISLASFARDREIVNPFEQSVAEQSWESSATAAYSFPLVTTEQTGRLESVAIAEAPSSGGNNGDGNSEGEQPNWPSPTLYPLRPTKKLKSMAAVDLPSFPRP